MTYVVPTAGDLQGFLGPTVQDLDQDFANLCIAQARVLLDMAATVTSRDLTSDETQLTTWAIMDMAATLYYKAPWREQMQNPFQAERIGSYSYDFGLMQITRQQPTSVFWFDKAVSYFGADGSVQTTATNLFFVDSPLTAVTLNGQPAIVAASEWGRISNPPEGAGSVV